MSKYFFESFLRPRRLHAEQAAKYLGVSRSKFLEKVKIGVYPKPIHDGGNTLWDIHLLDKMVDAQSGLRSMDDLERW